MAGFAKGKRYAATGEPYCRACRKVIWSKEDLDTKEENMHFKCAEIKREDKSRKAARVPVFKTPEEEQKYRQQEAEEWVILQKAW